MNGDQQWASDEKVNAAVTAWLAGERDLARDILNVRGTDGAAPEAEHIERLALALAEAHGTMHLATSYVVALVMDLAAVKGTTAEEEWQHFLDVRRRGFGAV